MKLQTCFMACGSLLLLVLLCFFPTDAKDAIVDGLRTCGSSVIPALFPFFVLSKMIVSILQDVPVPKFLSNAMERIFGVEGGCASALLMSFLGGYPVGVSCIMSQYEAGSIRKDSAEKALLFCNNSGPGFFLGMVGTVALGSLQLGVMLYLIHIISALTVGRLMSQKSTSTVKLRRITGAYSSPAQRFIRAITESCTALLNICGFILFFSLLLQLMSSAGVIGFIRKAFYFLDENVFCALIYGCLELTGGILQLRQCIFAVPLAAFLMGWGGFCVHFQAMSMWQQAGLHPKGYYLSKLLHGLLSALIAGCFIAPSGLKILALGMIFLFSAFLPYFRKKSSRNSAQFAL